MHVRQVEIKHPPLFIVGHYRSGTSLLHELLDRDPNVRAGGRTSAWGWMDGWLMMTTIRLV